jgi:hypothetical protein
MSSSYAANGDAFNVQNNFLSTSSPTVTVAMSDGYPLEHNEGTAAAGTVMAYQTHLNSGNGSNQNAKMIQVTTGTDLSAVNAAFIAIGQAY